MTKFHPTLVFAAVLALVCGALPTLPAIGESPRPTSAAPAPADSPSTQSAYPLWDGKETVAAYAKRAGIKKPELVLDLGANVSMKLALIPAGKFLMGVSKEEEPLVNALVHNGVGSPADQLPQHAVAISKPFYMGIFTVTQEQYQQVTGKNPDKIKNAHFPAGTVTWDDAAEFGKKMSEKVTRTVRLPTEAEWEYACRAGTTTPFYTGMTISTDQANYDGTVTPFGKGVKGVYRNKMLPVGSFKPNPWGLYDMYGNAQQWVADWYSADYYAKSPEADPKGPESGGTRVLRGATYSYGPRHCRSAYRDHLKPSVQGDVISFRVVAELTPADAK